MKTLFFSPLQPKEKKKGGERRGRAGVRGGVHFSAARRLGLKEAWAPTQGPLMRWQFGEQCPRQPLQGVVVGCLCSAAWSLLTQGAHPEPGFSVAAP